MARHTIQSGESETLVFQIADRSIELSNTQPRPHWAEIAFRVILTDIGGPWVPAIEKAHPGSRAGTMIYNTCCLGFAARRAECEIFRVPSVNATLEAALADGHHGGVADDWFALVCTTAASLMHAADNYPMRQPTSAALEPAGVGHAARRRLAEMIVDHVIYHGLGGTPQLGSVSIATVVDSWRFGYYLSACNDSLPDGASEELSAGADKLKALWVRP